MVVLDSSLAQLAIGYRSDPILGHGIPNHTGRGPGGDGTFDDLRPDPAQEGADFGE